MRPRCRVISWVDGAMTFFTLRSYRNSILQERSAQVHTCVTLTKAMSSSTNKSGRRQGAARAFVDDCGADSNGATLYKCAAQGCSHQRLTKGFPTTKWADHIVLDCKFSSPHVKWTVASTHRTKRITEGFAYSGIDPARRKSEPEALQKSSAIEEHKFPPMIQNKSEKIEPVLKRRKVTPSVDFCDERRAEVAIEKMTLFLVGCALPFDIVNSTFFIDMIKSLNTSFIQFLPRSEPFRTVYMPKLYDSTIQEVQKMWASQNYPLLTLGFDSFKSDSDVETVFIIESAGNKRAFKACVDLGGRRADFEFFAKIAETHLVSGASQANKPVEETYAGLVADNVPYIRRAFSRLKQKFPTLFFVSCAVHCFGLVVDELTQLPEFRQVISISSKGRKFVVADFDRIVDSRFEGPIEDDTRKKMAVVHDLLKPISRVIQHIESINAKASWVYMLVNILITHGNVWAEKESTRQHFSMDTIMAVKATIATGCIWTESTQLGLKQPIHTLAWILDPFTTPATSELPAEWENECREILMTFYPNADDLEASMIEVKQLLLGYGGWGDVIRRKQESIKTIDSQAFDSCVDQSMRQQEKMGSSVEDWQITGVGQFPKLAPVAVRLCLLSVQSANIARCCNAPNILDAKARHLLHAETVNMLLYTYVNLRLMNKCTEEMGTFLTQCLEGCEQTE